MAGVVVVFDFDRTIIDGDSDRWVVDEMGVTDSFNLLRPTLPWNSLMNAVMGEIHAQGKTLDDVAECLRRTQLDPRIIAAIRSAYALGCELQIVSDANQFFIETILKHHGLLDCFAGIVTNPALVDQQGKLRILPFHDSTSPPHGCPCCPPNLCKGMVMARIQDSVFVNSNKRFIYLGDGSGDFCPCLKLGEEDFVMPRKDFPLWNLICKSDPLLVKAEVHEWSNGDELEKILLRLINRILSENKTRTEPLASVDCKLQTAPVALEEALAKALPVRY